MMKPPSPCIKVFTWSSQMCLKKRHEVAMSAPDGDVSIKRFKTLVEAQCFASNLCRYLGCENVRVRAVGFTAPTTLAGTDGEAK